jgi:hypothetical protein
MRPGEEKCTSRSTWHARCHPGPLRRPHERVHLQGQGSAGRRPRPRWTRSAPSAASTAARRCGRAPRARPPRCAPNSRCSASRSSRSSGARTPRPMGRQRKGLDRVPGGACGGCMPRARLQAVHDERECIHRRRGWRPWPRRFASRRGRAPPRLRGMRTAVRCWRGRRPRWRSVRSTPSRVDRMCACIRQTVEYQ